nr:immunoglobulin light chain junction region [Macaca mulatta]NSL97415.1 immunoglobulin light chain junction region [Mus musculus]NSL97420.1 immunoglobulin light chain junction region [Mus musculus]NSL97887.1 immunoglobulin light chain junction region [Mus musculus]
CQHHYGTPYTF